MIRELYPVTSVKVIAVILVSIVRRSVSRNHGALHACARRNFVAAIFPIHVLGFRISTEGKLPFVLSNGPGNAFESRERGQRSSG